MNNEAKYICCLGGFIGFVSFFTISLLLGEDILSSAVRGSVGCLFCSLCARGILHLVLRPFAMAKNEEDRGAAAEVDASLPSTRGKEMSPADEIVREPNGSTLDDARGEASPATIESVAA